MKRRLFVLLNPLAGAHTAHQARQAFEQYFAHAGCSYELYEITGEETEDVAAIAHQAAEQEFDIVVAAGGDGTVSSVANGLVESDIPLGIIPIGTANILAKELNIPLNLNEACELLVSDYDTTCIDAMLVGEQFFFLQIGIGLDALVMSETPSADKRRFGLLAFAWNTLVQLVGYQPHRFTIVADEQRLRPRAAQVLIANGGMFGIPLLRWAPDIYPNDGHIDVCIVYARTLFDYIGILWHMLWRQQRRSRRMRYLTAQKRIIVHPDHPLPIQADGEPLEHTPLQVQIVQQAIRLVVPPAKPTQQRHTQNLDMVDA